ncbi:MAG: ferrochelatase [Nitrospirota bacterium]
MNTKSGVLLITMGDPVDLRGVFPYLMRLFSDPLILRAPGPLRPFLAYYISLMKKEPVKEKYQAIGGGSPMDAITERQAAALREALKDKDISVYHSNRYTRPSVQDAYKQIKNDGIKRLLALPLYPHFSPAITGSSFNLLKGLTEKDVDPPEIVYHEGFGADHRFIKLLAERTKEALLRLSVAPEVGRPASVIFSAHSLPEELISRGDPYLDNVMHSASMLQEELGEVRTHVGFQSKGRAGMEWLKPETDEVLKSLSAEGADGAVVVPMSFVSENIETLYDCDILQRSLTQSLGMRYERARSLDDDAGFIKFLAELALENL